METPVAVRTVNNRGVRTVSHDIDVVGDVQVAGRGCILSGASQGQ